MTDPQARAVLKEAVDAVVNSFAKHTHGYGRGKSRSAKAIPTAQKHRLKVYKNSIILVFSDWICRTAQKNKLVVLITIVKLVYCKMEHMYLTAFSVGVLMNLFQTMFRYLNITTNLESI